MGKKRFVVVYFQLNHVTAEVQHYGGEILGEFLTTMFIMVDSRHHHILKVACAWYSCPLSALPVTSQLYR